MKTRILSAIVGVSLTIFVLFFYETIILNIAVSIISAIMVYEVIRTIDLLNKSILIFIFSELYAITYPFLNLNGFFDFRVKSSIIYFLLLTLILLKKHIIINVEKLVLCGCFVVAISFFMSTIVYIRDDFAPYSLYYIMFLFTIAWICDAGAYFVGRGFGKRKLSPNISPNKTIEGAIGGVITNFIFVGILTYVFANMVYPGVKLNWITLIFVTLVGSVFAIVGDLSASIVKRQYKIKDFGNIIPGHGGLLDRFDSWIFVSAVSYPLICAFPIIG